jgi:hypothetical protein
MASILRKVSDMHFCETQDEYRYIYYTTLQEWRKGPFELVEFAHYFDKQWGPSSRFANWQMFHTPQGYSSTNNPVETFNAVVKKVNMHNTQTNLHHTHIVFRKSHNG